MKFVVKILTLASLALGGTAWDCVEAVEHVEQTYTEYQDAKKQEESVRATSGTKSEVAKAATNTRIKKQSHVLTCDQACSYLNCRDSDVKKTCMKLCPTHTIGHCVGGVSTNKSEVKHNAYLAQNNIALDENKIPMPSGDDREDSLRRDARPKARSASISRSKSAMQLTDGDEEEHVSVGGDGKDEMLSKRNSRARTASTRSIVRTSSNSNLGDEADLNDGDENDNMSQRTTPSSKKRTGVRKSPPASTDVSGTKDGDACVCSITGLKPAPTPSASSAVNSNNSAASNAATTVVKEADAAPASPAPMQAEKVAAAPPAATKTACEVAGAQNDMSADDAAASGLC